MVTPVGSGYGIDCIDALVVQPDGKIVAGGQSWNGDNSHDFTLARYNTDGSLDTTFGTDGIVVTPAGINDDAIYALAIQDDGKIVAGGYSWNAPNHFDFALARYNTDGSLDTTFGTDGITKTHFGTGADIGTALAIQADGRIVLAGNVSVESGDDFGLARYNTDGSLDTTFGTDGIVITPIGSGQDIATALGIQGDGKIVAAGYSSNGTDYDFAVVRYWP